HIEIAHEYGVTEVAVMSTIRRHQQKGDMVTIGKPIWNTGIFIVNKEGGIQPIGVPGEIYISGAGVVRGYLNQPELTARRFVTNPFSKGERVYRTGDLGRWMPDGNIEFLGRLDRQVKIRGYRIELGEIDNHVLRYERIKDAVTAIVEEANGHKRLVSYYVENEKKNHQPELWPSVAEFFVYDDLLYYAMTKDELRNDRYKIAINHFVKDKVVVDVGTGKDAILARFCAEAGAKKVYALEILDETYKKAGQTIKEAGLEEKIC
ncbi:MAG: amino acid adenylation domain-containing protein, partial [bacterium]|nr:amino acid adenylation domain-containing protein [bacterium]